MRAQWSPQRGTTGAESGNNLNPTVIGFKRLGCWIRGTPFHVIYLCDLCSVWRNGEQNGKSATGCSVIHSSAVTLPKALSSRTLLNVQNTKKWTISRCPVPAPLSLSTVGKMTPLHIVFFSRLWISILLLTEDAAVGIGLDWMYQYNVYTFYLLWQSHHFKSSEVAQ